MRSIYPKHLCRFCGIFPRSPKPDAYGRCADCLTTYRRQRQGVYLDRKAGRLPPAPRRPRLVICPAPGCGYRIPEGEPCRPCALRAAADRLLAAPAPPPPAPIFCRDCQEPFSLSRRPCGQPGWGNSQRCAECWQAKYAPPSARYAPP